jgi:hypothetical protein
VNVEEEASSKVKHRRQCEWCPKESTNDGDVPKKRSTDWSARVDGVYLYAFENLK